MSTLSKPTFSFANNNGIIRGSLTIGSIPLQEFSEGLNFYYVNHSPSTISLAEDVMKAENKVYLYIQGIVDSKPVTFTSTFLYKHYY